MRPDGEARRERDGVTGQYVEKFSDEIVRRICDVIAAGAPIETAAAYAGVSKGIFYQWLKKGRETQPDPRFLDFVERVDLALAQWEVRDLAIIGKAAEEQWQAAAWRLERRKPEVYGRRSRVDHANAEGQPLQLQVGAMVDYSKLTDVELEALQELHEKARVEIGGAQRALGA